MTGVETDLGLELTQLLQGGASTKFVWAYALAFVAGLFTSLTPCVYPLIPITVGLFGARDEKTTRLHAMFLAACYVGGIAAMYTSLGVIVGLTGGQFGTFMASKAVMVPVALFFIAMSASMFGAFELGLPSEWQARLSGIGGKGAAGAFLMGLVAGLIAAPCTGPPLAALLVFVGTQKSVVLGGSLLFTYAIGMGLLFFAIAGFALNLPRSGAWMDAVKSAFGVVMLVAALYFLRNVLSPLRDYGRPHISFLALHGAAIIAGAVIGGLHLNFGTGSAAMLRKTAGILLLTVGIYGCIAWMLTPKQKLPWLHDEAEAVALAKREHRPLVIDFGADWCAPCKKFEVETFANPEVYSELERFVLLKIDATNPSDTVDQLEKKYEAETLPAVLVFDGQGQRVVKIGEWMAPDKLLPILKQTK